MRKFKKEIYISILYSVLSISVWFLTVKIDSPLNIHEEASLHSILIFIFDFLIMFVSILIFKPVNIKNHYLIPLLSSAIISFFFIFAEKKYEGLGLGITFPLIYYFLYIYILYILNLPMILLIKKRQKTDEKFNNEVIDDFN